MNEIDTSQENKLIINKFETTESNNQAIITNDFKVPINDEINLYMNASVINEDDVNTLSEQFNKLPSCLNEFLRLTMNNPNGYSKMLEIYRKKLKIKIYKIKNLTVCQWCEENCLKYLYYNNYEEKDIIEINYNICMCGIKNHNISLFEKKNSLDNDDKKEINEINKIKEEEDNYSLEELKKKY